MQEMPIEKDAVCIFTNGRQDVGFQNYFCLMKEDPFFSSWVKGFTPLIISVDKYLYATFDENYRFIPVKMMDGTSQEYMDLSESENAIFQYLCFLEVNRYEMQKGTIPKGTTLYLYNFLERLEDSIDVDGLLKRATDLGFQVYCE